MLKSNSAEAPENKIELDSMDHEANSKNGKRRRDTIDSNESNTPTSKPVKKDKKIPRMASEGNMEDITLDATPSLPNTEESTQILSINDTLNPLDPDAHMKPNPIYRHHNSLTTSKRESHRNGQDGITLDQKYASNAETNSRNIS